jgi:endonuclease YncB( thermonuclease family)
MFDDIGLGSAGIGSGLVGIASVIDGDTIEIHGTRIRLTGIDAPESRQFCEHKGEKWLCGKAAAMALADHIAGRTVDCRSRGTDRYGRTLAVCLLGSEDINGWLVMNGWAMAYRHYSTAYVGEEDAAKAAKRGIWTSVFIAPWDWRKAH